MSVSLKRAREPYRIRNALTGLLLAGFAVGVWAWSISSVKQDVFDDVDEEARELIKARDSANKAAAAAAAPPNAATGGAPASSAAGTTGVVTVGRAGAGSGSHAAVDGTALSAATAAAAPSSSAPLYSSPTTTTTTQNASTPALLFPSLSQKPRGILQHLSSKYPRLLDPNSKTLIWGAPPVDDIGRLSVGSRG